MRFITLLLIGLNLIACNQYKDLDDGLYTLIQTTEGDMLLRLNEQETPITVANFVSLSEGNNPYVNEAYKNKPYYDGVSFHRVIEEFMIQGGDPTGTGSGNPGYKFKDEIADSLFHDKKGILSMANSGPKTNGSQFFITHVPTPWLDGRHTIFGELVEGFDVLDSIATSKTDSSDKPETPIIMNKVKIIRVGNEAKNFDEVEILKAYFGDEKEAKLKQEKAQAERAASFEELFADAEITNSGLEIVVRNQGEGSKPKIGQTVNLNYAGWLTDGTLFDTSVYNIAFEDPNFNNINSMHRGVFEPMKMPFEKETKMIPGFTEGVLGMRVGDVKLFRIPTELAFGSKGAGNVIPANADVIFQIELVSIEE